MPFATCCSVLQCVAVRVAVRVAVSCFMSCFTPKVVCCKCVAVCCKCVAVCCKCVAVCCKCVAVCCNALRDLWRIARHCNATHSFGVKQDTYQESTSTHFNTPATPCGTKLVCIDICMFSIQKYPIHICVCMHVEYIYLCARMCLLCM